MKPAIFICVIGIVFLFAVTIHAQGYGYGHGMMGGYGGTAWDRE